MACETVATDSRKFDWADDDNDDFDLDSWNATADTSAPTADELGPLQVPPTEDVTKDEEEAYTLSRVSNERAYLDPPVAKELPDAELTQGPDPVAQLPAEYWYLAVLNCRPEQQVTSARFDRITRAIGFRYDGKDEPEAPAYPEFSNSKAYRSSYMAGFQKWKIEHRSLSCSKVYRNSPLNIVTSIENAHEIDDIVDRTDEEVEEIFDEDEHTQIFPFEQEEQVQTSVSDQFERDRDADREMNEEIDRMLVDQSKNNVDISKRFSRKELEGLYHHYKALQLEADKSDAEELYAKVKLSVIKEEDTTSIDSWEACSWDEELFEPHHPCAEDDGMSFLVIGSMDDDKTLSSIKYPFDAAATEEELDFNDVVFGFGDDAKDHKAETKSETDSEPSDEGYASSSPPITPTLESFRTIGKRHTKDDFIPAEMRLSSSSMRRKTNGRTDSMDALNAFRQAARNEQPVDDAFEEEEENDEVAESIQEESISYDELKEPFGANEGSEFALIVVPPEEENRTKVCPLSDLALVLIEQANSVILIEEDDQVHYIDNEGRGILDLSFAFPGLSADHTSSATKSTVTTSTTISPHISASKSSSRRWSDPRRYFPGPASALPSSATRHKKQNSLSLDYLASAITKSRFYICEVPWAQVSIMTAGVVAGGLLSMVGRH
jgi:hypothetical protein